MSAHQTDTDKIISSLKNTIREQVEKLKEEIFRKFPYLQSKEKTYKNCLNDIPVKESEDKPFNILKFDEEESIREDEGMEILSVCFYTNDVIVYSTPSSLKLFWLTEYEFSQICDIDIQAVTFLLTLKNKWIVASSEKKTTIINIIKTQASEGYEKMLFEVVHSFTHEDNPIRSITELSRDRMLCRFEQSTQIISLKIPFDPVFFEDKKYIASVETRDQKYFILITEGRDIFAFDSTSYSALGSFRPKDNLQVNHLFSFEDSRIIFISDDFSVLVYNIPSFQEVVKFRFNDLPFPNLKIVSSCNLENEIFFFLSENEGTMVFFFNYLFQINCVQFNYSFFNKKIVAQGDRLLFWNDEWIGWIQFTLE